MTSEDIIEVALDLAQLAEIPGDSGVHVRSDNIKKVLATIDCDVGDLFLARELKCDTVLTHHPEGTARASDPRINAPLRRMARIFRSAFFSLATVSVAYRPASARQMRVRKTSEGQ